ncbi:aldehyde dehydrogenase family 3 member A2-like [Harmonia axyridis]|uniref:aldehyde dehydrogenase family 3 member A2-like n=1 Tax=Harmonia axyridis TaxID=115357 RepID=UPI001E277DF2|nr:aldehyde dehydrogenase family 3 member A2-like [Harmonia axyridis]XP_045477098.1 aldehyde dehydrogenase family 3 member A2-like [Harmonia axyridis]XP_045477099.1 aldehyde dehydrogenase family 3 member A2-like [Harmonia axyridis]XP_045477100.1 aldehyde dehydrogenase family 3 member A2-like [Harmonia axyridis]
MESQSEILDVLRNSFNNGKTRSLEFRRKQLKNVWNLLEENETEFIQAMLSERKVLSEIICEIQVLKNDILHMLHNLDRLTKPKSAEKNLVTIISQIEILPEPYGVVLVIGAWNYPLVLAFTPLIGALAAGNCVLVKPSEMAPVTAQLIAKLVPQYLDKDCYKVFIGGPTESQQLLENRFDYIFYTGSNRIGSIVMQMAAKHFTPVTLEMGGKSPCYIDSSVDIEIVAARILWGKAVNAGQACIAPDYVVCTEEIEKKFIEAFKKVQKERYGLDMRQSQDYCRIINLNHFNRLLGLLEGQEIVHGGNHDIKELYMDITICSNVDRNSDLMKDEIFGPILPIVRVKDAQDALNLINSKEKPLALYVFSNKKKIVDLFIERTSSGGVCVNDTMMHFSCDTLPFGGVGHSGLGAYHGDLTFSTFSHSKPILKQPINSLCETVLTMRYAPITEGKMKLVKVLMKKRRTFISAQFLLYILLVVVGFLICYIFLEYGENIKTAISSPFK